jgi:hypothetical protein
MQRRFRVLYGRGLVGVRSRRRGANCEDDRESRPKNSGRGRQQGAQG